jgi:hypothetical protein
VQGLAGGLLIPAGQTILGQAVGSHRLGRVMASLEIAVSVTDCGLPFGPRTRRIIWMACELDDELTAFLSRASTFSQEDPS